MLECKTWRHSRTALHITCLYQCNKCTESVVVEVTMTNSKHGMTRKTCVLAMISFGGMVFAIRSLNEKLMDNLCTPGTLNFKIRSSTRRVEEIRELL